VTWKCKRDWSGCGENAQLKNKERDGLTLKVSEKGAVSIYGMGRFPVTLYKE
jgi:hypothetical protein